MNFGERPRPWLVGLWEASGAIGLVVAVVGAFISAIAIGPWFDTLGKSFEVSARALDAVDQTVDVVDVSLGIFEETLTGVDGVLVHTEASLEEVSAVVLSTAGLLSEDIPEQVDAISAAMEGLIDTANVVDGILGALSFVGVDYDPATPLDLALIEVNAELAQLGGSLSGNADELFSLAVSLNRLNEEIATTNDSLGGLVGQLDESRRLIDQYKVTAGDAQLLLLDASARLAGQVWVVRIFGVVLLLLLGVLFSAIWWLGRSIRLSGSEDDMSNEG